MKYQKRGWFLVVLFLFSLVIISLNSADVQAANVCVLNTASPNYCKDTAQGLAENECKSNQTCISLLISTASCTSLFEQGNLPECEKGYCLSGPKASCSSLTRKGLCSKDGVFISENDIIGKNQYCQPGCCKVYKAGTKKWCGIKDNYPTCQKDAEDTHGVLKPLWETSIKEDAKCLQSCGEKITPTALSGTVTDEAGQPLIGVTVTSSEQETKTDDSGVYTISTIYPGKNSVQYSLEGYSSVIQELELMAEPNTYDVILKAITAEADIYTLTVNVKYPDPSDSENLKLLNKVNIVLIETSGLSKTGSTKDGAATFTLSPGEYTLTLSKSEFKQSGDCKAQIVDAELSIDCLMEPAAFQGLTGTVTGVYKYKEEVILEEVPEGIIISIKDKPFKIYAETDGSYKLDLPDGEYTALVSAFGYTDFTFDFTIKSNVIDQPVILEKKVGICSKDGPEPTKAVLNFEGKQVPGQKAVQLKWEKPCPEVSGYFVYRYHGEEKVQLNGGKMFSLAAVDYVDSDEELLWEETYTYEIQVYYEEGDRYSEFVSVSVKLGSASCEGMYKADGTPKKFCDPTGKKIQYCQDDEIIEEDCPTETGKNFYCVSDPSGSAACKDTGVCSIQQQNAKPFGLFYSRELCYGTEESPNPCYFDFTSSSVDACIGCDKIQSCFQYNGQEACEKNQCRPNNKNCLWVSAAEGIDQPEGGWGESYAKLIIDFVTYPLGNLNTKQPKTYVSTETGHGYCVEEGYKKSDQCLKCDSSSDLFENFFCTPEVCSSLGNCYSQSGLTSCASCSQDTTCYDYASQLECVGSQNNGLNIDEQKAVSPSTDRCQFKKCKWNNGQCFKDGNDNDQDDCTAKGIECKKNKNAPETKTIPEMPKTLSQTNPSLEFISTDKDGKDQIPLLYLCISSKDDSACNTFQQIPDYKKGKTINLKGMFFQNEKPNCEADKCPQYLLRYYAVDEYDNQESVKEKTLLVDLLPPEFELTVKKEDVDEDTANVKVVALPLEPASCHFNFTRLIPASNQTWNSKIFSAEEKIKETTFANLGWGVYKLKASCADNWGNSQTKEEIIIFNNPQVQILSPQIEEVLASSEITFAVQTSFGASCGLYQDESLIAAFDSSDNLNHTTFPISGFADGEYSDYKVKCTALITEEGEKKTAEAYFYFIVDMTGPQSIITTVKDLFSNQEVEKTEDLWIEEAVSKVEISFACGEESGYPCKKIFYCQTGLEGSCSPEQEYSKPFIVNQSSVLYYLAEDEKAQQGTLHIGTIKIVGFGIQLVNPEFGVSNQPVFDLQINTAVSTEKCKLEFDEDFNFNTTVNPDQIFTKKDSHAQEILNFPNELYNFSEKENQEIPHYIRCTRESDGLLGPSQKITLQYDSTAPYILQAYAKPVVVTSGNAVDLFVKTDDKTFCKYDEVTDAWDSMAYTFPGFEQVEHLNQSHKTTLTLPGGIKKQNFSYFVVCENGARDLSNFSMINFSVDFTLKGYFTALWPNGEHFNQKEITLHAETSKYTAWCKYTFGNETDIPFEDVSGEGLIFEKELTNLKDEEYQYILKCKIGPEILQDELSFVIDTSPPIINSIEDGNKTCFPGNPIHVAVEVNDSSPPFIYSYLLKNSKNAAIASDNVSSSPFDIELENLTVGEKYSVEISVIDSMGNSGAAKKSDGFNVFSSNDTKNCDDKQIPKMNYTEDLSSCKALKVNLKCQDNFKCKVDQAGWAYTSSDCKSGNYSTPFQFNKTTYLCYFIADEAGNTNAGTYPFNVEDKDGDKILDIGTCDKCLDTPAGASVDSTGCTDKDNKINKPDSDKDQLPDSFEILYDSETCLLDKDKADSDGDKVLDNLEDYDNDGITNYEEYLDGTDPCSADDKDTDGDGILDKDDKCKKTPASEIKNVIKTKADKNYGCAPSEITSAGTTPFVDDDPKPGGEEAFPWGWVFIILGLLMISGGAGYLYYSQQQQRKSSSKTERSFSMEERPKSAAKPAFSLGEKFKLFERRTAEKLKKKEERSQVFEAFGGEEQHIPHVEKILAKEGVSPVKKVAQIFQKYTENKAEIQPTLNSKEKDVFEQLVDLSEKHGQVKNIPEKQAKDIFRKLDGIVKTRHKGKKK